MIHYFKTSLVAALLLTGATQWGMAQTQRPATGGGEPPWYVGVQGGTSFGQGTFRSITEHQIHWGWQGGILGGYRLNRLLSLEAGFQYGAQSQGALDCCTYWLSEDGTRYMNPVVDQTGWYYHDLDTRSQWGKLALQVNANLLSLFTAPDCRWSLNLSPQLSAVTVKTRIIAPDKEIDHDRQWHLGLGGQASVGYQITERIGASLYGGITCLTGERFDNIPVHAHKSNLMYDAGVKVVFSLGGKSSGSAQNLEEAPYVPVEPDDEADRLAAEKAEQERLEAEQAERAEQERLEAERAEQERLAAEQAAREEAERLAFSTPIPHVYFANDSDVIERDYYASLEAVRAILQQYPDFNLEIHAYCSNTGSKEYNNRLSQKRMEAILNWFTEHGIDPERLTDAYYHGIDYDAPSAEEARRAELKFIKGRQL